MKQCSNFTENDILKKMGIGISFEIRQVNEQEYGKKRAIPVARNAKYGVNWHTCALISIPTTRSAPQFSPL